MKNENIHVYVAGPLHSSGRATNNIHRAVEVGHMLAEQGVVPFVPHLFAYWDMIFPASTKFWLTMDKAWLELCHAIYILPGDSRGVDQEREWAEEIGMPIFEGEDAFDRLLEWVNAVQATGLSKPQKPALTLAKLQEELAPWVKHNFGDRPSYHPLLGMGEELGELMHAHLKSEQGIRGTKEEHHAAKVDALADIIVFAADYASSEGIDLQDALEKTWEKVSKRDWRKDPVHGVVAQTRQELLQDEMAKRGALSIPKHEKVTISQPREPFAIGQEVRSFSGRGGNGIGKVLDTRTVAFGEIEYHCGFDAFRAWFKEHELDPVTSDLYTDITKNGVRVLKATGPRLVDVEVNGRYTLLANNYRPDKEVQVTAIYSTEKVETIDLEDETTTYTVSPVELGPLKMKDEDGSEAGGAGA